jgi:hypothetical protein
MPAGSIGAKAVLRSTSSATIESAVVSGHWSAAAANHTR